MAAAMDTSSTTQSLSNGSQRLGASFTADFTGAVLISLGIGIGSISPMVCVTVLAAFIVSPLSLYLDRAQSTIVVFMLIGAALISQLLRGECCERSESCKTLTRAAGLFAAYMGINCFWSIVHGTPWPAALNELIPVCEMFLCFWLVTHMHHDARVIQNLVLLLLILIAIRGVWQLAYFVAGKADLLIPPIKAAGEWGAEEISGYQFVRLIDPISGVHVGIAFALFWTASSGVARNVSLIAMGIGSAVLILGLTRAEWIGAALCIGLVLVHRKRFDSHTFKQVALILLILLTCAVLLSVFFQRMSLDLGEIVTGRALTYTQEQLFAPRDSLQALRLLEIGTVMNAFRSSPVFGAGLGADVGTVVSDGSADTFVVIHNYYLNMLAKAGLTGVLLLMCVLARAVKVLRKLMRNRRPASQAVYLLVAAMGMLWYGILLAFQPIFSAYHIPSLLGIYLGIAISLNDPIVAQKSDC